MVVDKSWNVNLLYVRMLRYCLDRTSLHSAHRTQPKRAQQTWKSCNWNMGLLRCLDVWIWARLVWSWPDNTCHNCIIDLLKSYFLNETTPKLMDCDFDYDWCIDQVDIPVETMIPFVESALHSISNISTNKSRNINMSIREHIVEWHASKFRLGRV